MMLIIDNLPYALPLGKQTETGVTTITIDMSPWLDQWPGMETVIMATRPGESEAYPAATRMDGSSIVWTVNGADTAIAGRGTAEILGLVDGVRKLSQIVQTRINASTVATTIEPPEGAKPWVDDVINAAEEIKNMTAQAETLQPGDAATASYADGKLTLGIPRGLTGAKGDKGDPGEPGAKGDRGPKGDPGSDASVTAANIEAALGYAPVTPSALAAKQDALTDADRQSITKTGMTTGAAWTDAEQKAARERMGVDKAYELIEEITLAEDSTVERSTEPDGTPYNFAAIMLRAEFPASDKKGNIFITYNVGNIDTDILSYFLYPYKANAVQYGYSKVWMENGRYHSGWWTCAGTRGQFAQYYENPVAQDIYSITDGNIIGFSTGVMAAGTKITIYGVRA